MSVIRDGDGYGNGNGNGNGYGDGYGNGNGYGYGNGYGDGYGNGGKNAGNPILGILQLVGGVIARESVELTITDALEMCGLAAV